MKKINLYLLVFFLLGVSSCNDEELIMPKEDFNTQINVNDSVFFRPEIDAVFTAINKITEAYPNDNRISKSKNLLTVKNIKSIKSNNSSSTNALGFYIINFEGGGFAMIPNDTRATEVYAYSNKGALQLGVDENVDYYISLANNCLNYEIENSNLTGLPITPVPDPTDPNNPQNYAIVYHGGHYCHKMPTRTLNMGSDNYLLKTEWHQYSPYYNLCLTSSGYNVAAGCVAIALGQIMAYHKKPLSYNNHTYQWEGITLFPIVMPGSSATGSVAELIHDIGTAAGINYLAGLSASNINKASDALGLFHYNRTISSYSFSIIANNIDSNRPCLIGGEDSSENGHTWVIDGYKSTSKTYKYYHQSTLELCSTDTETVSYVHCNWGWSGESNGFFLDRAFYINNGDNINDDFEFNYSNNLKLIHNIYQ